MYKAPGQETLCASSSLLILANSFRQMKSGHPECQEQPKGIRMPFLGEERKGKRKGEREKWEKSQLSYLTLLAPGREKNLALLPVTAAT